MNRLFPMLSFLFIFLNAACSLKYDETIDSQSVSPELQFTKVDYKKYKNKKLDTRIEADILERYKSDGSAYAKNASFSSWNTEEELVTEGNCSLLGIDSENEIYTLFNSIFLHNIDQKFEIRATNLKWNGKTEQLTSGKNDIVYLNRDDIEIEGTGFSASGISRSFTFENSVTGAVISKDEDEENSEEKPDEEN